MAAKIPNGIPKIIPPKLVKRPASKKARLIDDGWAPAAFSMAISLLRSITSITIADEILAEATKTIKNIINISIFFVVLKEVKAGRFKSAQE